MKEFQVFTLSFSWQFVNIFSPLSFANTVLHVKNAFSTFVMTPIRQLKLHSFTLKLISYLFMTLSTVRPNSTHPASSEMFYLFMRCVPLVLFSHFIILNIILFKKSCNSKNVSFSSLWYFKKVHSIQQHIFRKCMLISYQIAEGAQLNPGTLKRSFVVQNKLHGPQNNECRRAKCISKKRGDITTVKNV